MDTLALSDATVVVDLETGPAVTCDLAVEDICGPEPEVVAGLLFGTPEHAQALAAYVEHQTITRNRADGWWVAAADSEAAAHARVATYARPAVRRASVMSDGATRPVDQMRICRWLDYLDLLDKLGPRALIAHVRSIEVDDPEGARYPRTKRHDDATVAQYKPSD
ncbi:MULTISPECIES: hypothetical protein [Micromonospora]|uniref:Uncharacterized protein n=1 Tax=Micromonospora sicca TaxID=2202420 RepID=A0A317DNF4_9ACTN|nr:MULTISPECIES: hypothetical protein [unclassified Micromonospora]MBM0227030.1 hypothetical protein [Micromonospora sp. ATA51]PWR15640.1 hypothetical protein DKT69_10170 [Micromonospora sp. 4G51]